MARGKVLFKNPQEGDIKIYPSNPSSTWIYTNEKWVYVKKRKPAKPKIVKTYNFPPVKIPPNMVETSFSGYYITKEGDAYREPVKYERMPVNENGLVYLKPNLRGHKKYPEKQYFCVNISIRDSNGKFIKQIKKSNHQLVAETFVPNPHGYTEVMHIDENNRNNHYTNLKWGTHLENMDGVISPCNSPKSFKITDTTTGKVWIGTNVAEWVRENYDLIIPRMKSSNHKLANIAKNLTNTRQKNGMIWKFKVEY